MCGGIQTLEEANTFLQSGNYRPLDEAETRRILPEWEAGHVTETPPATPSAQERRAQALEAFLEPPQYTRLFGLDDAHRLLLEALVRPGPPWVLAVVGIGGIGKTALADAATRQAIRRFCFDHISWLRVASRDVSATQPSPGLTFETFMTALAGRLLPQLPDGTSPQERLVQVRQVLKARPHLTVIDNLEAEADTAYLLDRIGDLAAPSKFLLTARTRPSNQQGVFCLSLDELTLKDAVALLREHAAVIGLTDLAAATDDDVAAVYQVVGGNPLAIKLVVSLAVTQPLPHILADLAHSQPGEIEELYRHIYWKAWQTLGPNARTLLRAMPLVAERGASPEHMRAISGLAQAQFWSTIRELVARSLLEIRGTVRERRYGIHRLTETFLRTEIIHWPEGKA
jgi:hypothetical protein